MRSQWRRAAWLSPYMCVLTAASCSPDETPLPTDGFVITGARVFDGEVVIEGQSVVVVETRI